MRLELEVLGRIFLLLLWFMYPSHLVMKGEIRGQLEIGAFLNTLVKRLVYVNIQIPGTHVGGMKSSQTDSCDDKGWRS